MEKARLANRTALLPRYSAFTLIELLIALSMLVIILGAVYGTFTATVGTLPRVQAKTALELEARSILRRMTREIRGCYPGRSREQQKSSDKDARSVRLGQAVPNFFAEKNASEGEILRFVTTAGVSALEENSVGLSAVSYLFDESEGALLRRQSNAISKPESTDGDEDWLPLSGNVRSIVVEYFDGEKWHDEWDADEKDGLPRAVRITLEMEGDESVSATVTAAARITARRKLRERDAASDGGREESALPEKSRDAPKGVAK